MEVEGDKIRERVENQIISELEVQGLNPFEFDYSDSKVIMYQKLESRKGKDLKDVIEKDNRTVIGNTKIRQNRNYFGKK